MNKEWQQRVDELSKRAALNFHLCVVSTVGVLLSAYGMTCPLLFVAIGAAFATVLNACVLLWNVMGYVASRRARNNMRQFIEKMERVRGKA